MLIKIADKAERPTDFFLYAQNSTTLEMFGYTADTDFSDMVVDEIDEAASQRCLPPSYGDYLTIDEITSELEIIKPVAITEMEEEIVKLRKYISNDRFPYDHSSGTSYFVMCGEGEHRDLIKGARRKAERDPDYTHFWTMFNADKTSVIVPMTNADLIDLANKWEDWGALVFEHAEILKMTMQTMRYEEIKNFDVDFTSMTTL